MQRYPSARIRSTGCALAALAFCGGGSFAQERAERDNAIFEVPQRAPVHRAGDAAPLPRARRSAEGPVGDVCIDPAAGNPFRLDFVAASYAPPFGEVVDPELVSNLVILDAAARPRPESFAFVMFQRRITKERIAELESLGARVLGFHPHYCLKVALSIEVLLRISELPYVRWVGVPRLEQKLDPRLVQAMVGSGFAAPLPVYVNLFDSDLCERSVAVSVGSVGESSAGEHSLPGRESERGVRWMSNGWQQERLQALGVEVLEYVDRIRAFRCRILASHLEALLRADFVQFVELDTPVEAQHDESTPMILADYTRVSWNGGTDAAVVAGEMDSGVDFGHGDLDGYYVYWNYTGNGTGVTDECGHGTHVGGTILGNGDNNAGLRGNAPGLAASAALRFFIVKFLEPTASGCSNLDGSSLATRLGNLDSSFTDGNGIVSPRPHVVNNSWGSNPWNFNAGGACVSLSPFTGTEADCRTMDAHIWDHNQIQVVSAGNYADDCPAIGTGSTIGKPAAAKNVLTVANVIEYVDAVQGDPGNLSASSSIGPCGDDRWKPNIAAPGRWINSAQAGTAGSFVNLNGTSMAAPHVTGVAAQLMDNYSSLRYAPHRVASILMATAMTKNDQTLSSPSTSPTHHLNMYGAGRIEAYKAHYATSQLDWGNWAFTADDTGFEFDDYQVNAGATRIVVVMHYIEDAASAGAAQALVNDFDLWIDYEPFTAGGNTGEYFAQQSAINNTEIRIINNPAEGLWRWKVYPESVTGTARVSVTFAIIYGDTTPDGDLTLTASDLFVQPGDDVTVTATVANPDYIASAVFLDATVSNAGFDLLASSTTLEDGAVTDLISSQSGWTLVNPGLDLLLGDIRHGMDRTATWRADWDVEGSKVWRVQARSDNWVDETQSVTITVDGTPPALPTILGSSTHTEDVWSNETAITFTWNAAIDNLSGVDGYGVYRSTTAPAAPGNIKDREENERTFDDVLNTSTNGYYFNVKVVDNCGNWTGAFASTGPYLIDTIAPSNGTITIAGGVATTRALLVFLNGLGATDVHSRLWRMQFSNDGASWSAWEPSAASRASWDLSTGGGGTEIGVKTVRVRYRDLAGNESPVYSDTIDFQPPPDATAIDPAFGAMSGNNDVTITGSYFIAGTTVTFGGVASESVVVVNASTLTVDVPRGPGGARSVDVAVVVTTANGADATPLNYIYGIAGLDR